MADVFPEVSRPGFLGRIGGSMRRLLLNSRPRPAVGRRLLRSVLLLAVEILLVLVIISLLIATWLPAIIGANPDAPKLL